MPISRRSSEQRKNSSGFGAHFGVERGHNTMGNSMSDCIKQYMPIIIWRALAHKIIVLQNQCAPKSLCSKIFGAEQHRDSPRVHIRVCSVTIVTCC